MSNFDIYYATYNAALSRMLTTMYIEEIWQYQSSDGFFKSKTLHSTVLSSQQSKIKTKIAAMFGV